MKTGYEIRQSKLDMFPDPLPSKRATNQKGFETFAIQLAQAKAIIWLALTDSHDSQEQNLALTVLHVPHSFDSQGHNLALTVLHVPQSFDSGGAIDRYSSQFKNNYCA